MGVTPQFEELLKKMAKLSAGSTAAHVPSVVVLLGSAQAGTGMLFEWLSQSGAFQCPQGDEAPFYRLATRNWVRARGDSDCIRVPVDQDVCAHARRLLTHDLGEPVPHEEGLNDPRYHAQCAMRLLLQWPELKKTARTLVTTIAKCAVDARDSEALWESLIKKLKLDPSRRHAADYILENPPYLIQRPRARPDATKPLLLKSPGNVYRTRWLKTLFPEADFKFIHVRRNPAGGISSLMDGWRSNGFHSHNVHGLATLKIRGYSDVVPGGDRWWKFDLPPGWADFAQSSLGEVCAYQWRTAYRTLQALPEPALEIAFEDLADPKPRDRALNQICGHAGVMPSRAFAATNFAANDWRKREKEIWPLVRLPAVRMMSEQLGYDLRRTEHWI